MSVATPPILPDSFQQILPSLGPWIDGLSTNPLAVSLQNVFAELEVVHILGLLILGAAVLLICLRLIGVGLVEASPSLIYRNTSGLLTLGVVLAIGAGLLMGLSNASKLYNNSAFLFKMIAMIAAIAFSYGVMAPAARKDGAVGKGARIAFVAALLIWLLALVIMVVKKGPNVAVFHLICAGGLIVFFATAGRQRWVMAGVSLLILAAWQLVTHVFVTQGTTDAQMAAYMGANKVFMVISAAWVLAAMLLNIFGRDGRTDSTAMAKLIGYATILVWVTVGAGGRWIGLT
jgi:hypothetical protein